MAANTSKKKTTSRTKKTTSGRRTTRKTTPRKTTPKAVEQEAPKAVEQEAPKAVEQEAPKAVEKVVEPQDRQLKIGIDLGTSKVAMQSSRGAKTVFASVVGYPKDIISAKLLKSDKAIGDEVLEKLSYLDVYFPLRTGVILETTDRVMDAAKDLLQHAVNLAAPADGDEICAVIGIPATASAASKEQIFKLTREMVDVTLVVSEPFMVGYGLGRLNNTIIVDIGAGTSDICALKAAVPAPEDQVTINKGGDYIDTVLQALLEESFPDIQVTKQLVQSIKEQYSFVDQRDEEIIVTFRADGKPGEYDITEEVKAACESLVSPIVEEIENILMRFGPEDQAEALQNIYLAGNGAKIKGLDQVLEAMLQEYGDVKITCVEDPDYAGCHGALQIAMELPMAQWGQLGDLRKK
ncbi:MAG: rod shape-determining protein [SAR324 cluster bacterium]|nr:rod shape-determining protein [SAR324 cluster bacterium]